MNEDGQHLFVVPATTGAAFFVVMPVPEGFQQDRQNVKAKQIKDFDAYPESDQMEEISRHLLLSRLTRPEADVEMLKRAGFKSILTDTKIGERVWDEREKINYASRPMFMICAYC